MNLKPKKRHWTRELLFGILVLTIYNLSKGAVQDFAEGWNSVASYACP